MDLLIDIYNEYLEGVSMENDNSNLEHLFNNEYEEFKKLKNIFCNKISFIDNLIHRDII